MTHSVEFQNVWLAYNKQLLAMGHFAVEDITLQMDQGEFIAIVGPSACGKSTFMKLTTGLNMPSQGTIRIDGQPVTGPLKISGMAFQAPSLLPWRTTLDNVPLPLEIVEPYRSSFRARRDEYVAKARKLLHNVGLGGYEDKFPWQPSGGMQQRASIGRALVHEPKMLLLDEPFGALDAFTREELWCAMRDLQAAQKFNVILVTYDLRESVFLAAQGGLRADLVVWFGIGAGRAILTAFLISFFRIMVNIATGLATLEPELEDVLRVLGAKRWDVLTKVGPPRSMPNFYGSLKVAITLAFVGTTVSVMTASNEGIGYLLISAGSSMQMGLAFSDLVVVGMMAMAM
jgi:NitT/TauT family transport system ATP-binding protein